MIFSLKTLLRADDHTARYLQALREDVKAVLTPLGQRDPALLRQLALCQDWRAAAIAKAQDLLAEHVDAVLNPLPLSAWLAVAEGDLDIARLAEDVLRTLAPTTA